MNLNVSLVPFREEHISLTFEWIQDPDFQQLFLMRDRPTWEGHIKYFDRILKDPAQRVYAILAESRHVGNCGMKNISLKEGELWIYIGDPRMRGKGIANHATRLLAAKGFIELGLEKIIVHVADFNVSAIKLYKKLGFIEVLVSDNSKDWANRGCNIIRMELKKQT